MDRVEEIEAAIDSLPREEFLRLSEWFRARDEALWDRQLGSDSSAGKLDFLFSDFGGAFMPLTSAYSTGYVEVQGFLK